MHGYFPFFFIVLYENGRMKLDGWINKMDWRNKIEHFGKTMKHNLYFTDHVHNIFALTVTSNSYGTYFYDYFKRG